MLSPGSLSSPAPEDPIEDQPAEMMKVKEEAVTTSFNPEGLRVLAVDDNIVCLKYLVALLHQCKYNVTETTNPIDALKILRQRVYEFDIVITDLKMLEMDGLVLLQKISLEMDIPVVMLSADDSPKNVMKAVRYGARDYIIKPPLLAQMKNIWQHVVREHLYNPKYKDCSNNKSLLEGSKRKLEETEDQNNEEEGLFEEAADAGNYNAWNGDANSSGTSISAARKKKRMSWTVGDLHDKFIDAIETLENLGKSAVPMEILKVMNVPGLTRANVASHLQKFKSALKNKRTQSALETNAQLNPALYQASCSGSYSLPAARLPYQQIDRHNSRNHHASSPNIRYANQQQCALNHHAQHYNILPMAPMHNNPSVYKAPTMLNNAPLPPKQVFSYIQSHPPLPQFKGLNFPALGSTINKNVSSSCFSFSQPNAAYSAPSLYSAPNMYAPNFAGFMSAASSSSAAAGSLVGNARQHDMLAPEMDWTAGPNMQDVLLRSSLNMQQNNNFNLNSSETAPMMVQMNLNNVVANPDRTAATLENANPSASNNPKEAQSFQNSSPMTTPQEELPIDATLQPINTNLSDDDDSDELNSIVKLLNCEGPPSL